MELSLQLNSFIVNTILILFHTVTIYLGNDYVYLILN